LTGESNLIRLPIMSPINVAILTILWFFVGCSNKVAEENKTLKEENEKEENEKLRGQVTEKDKRIAKFETEVEFKDRASEEQNKGFADLGKRYDSVATALAQTKEKFAQSEAHVDKGESEKKLLSNQNDTLAKKANDLEKKTNDLEAELKKMDLLLKSATTESEANKKKIAAMEQDQRQTVLDQGTKISGVVTYYFNENYGAKPDTGASVYIFPSGSYPEEEKLVQQYLQIKTKVLLSSPKDKKDLARQVSDELRVSTKEEGAKYLEKILKSVTVLKFGKATVKTVADGNGGFQKTVKPGTYQVLVVSNHRTGIDSTLPNLRETL